MIRAHERAARRAAVPGRLAPGAAHYESYFVKAHHPSEPQRVLAAPHGPPAAGRAADRVAVAHALRRDAELRRAGKQTVGPDGCRRPTAATSRIAGADLHAGPRDRRRSQSPTLDAGWDFTFATDASPSCATCPPRWMYDAALPRTKSATPHPGVTFQRALGDWDLDGWRGLVSHNWGSEHAERWIWTALRPLRRHDGARGSSSSLGRIKLGRVTTPWIANGALQLDGERHRLGGPQRARSTKVDEHADRRALRRSPATARARRGRDRRARASASSCWRYADPDGPEHHSAHSLARRPAR